MPLLTEISGLAIEVDKNAALILGDGCTSMPSEARLVSAIADVIYDKEVLIDIRNGFCHNSYPENSICHKEYYQIKRKEDSFGFSAEEGIKEENTIAHYLYEKFRLEQEKIMKLE